MTGILGHPAKKHESTQKEPMTDATTSLTNLAAALTGDDETVYSELVDTLFRQCTQPDNGRRAILTVDCGAGPETMTAGRALVNLALLYPYRAVGAVPTPDRFVRTELDVNALASHLDTTTTTLYGVADPETLSVAVGAATNFLADLACAITGRVGTTVSIKGLLDAAKQDPRVWELLFWQAGAGELGDIEKAADAASDELAARLKALPGEFGRMLRCGAAINKDQLRQAVLNVGVKPGLLDGELIPEPIDTSFLRGMRGVEDFFVCAVGARKALTTNYKQVKTSGYLSRKLVLLVANHTIDPELHDCGTPHGVVTTVQSEDHARRLVGRYWSNPTSPGDWQLTRTVEDAVALVGQEIILRSPKTCAGEKGVCHVCYGELARANASLHAGIYGVLVICEQFIQRLLASKHLLKARPIKIAWPEEFLHSFSVERTAVIAENNVDRVYVRLEDVEDDEDEERRTTAVFSYRVAGRQARIRITTPVPLFLDPDAWDGAETEDGEMTIQPSQEAAVFHVPVTNTDLSEALYKIFGLLEREDLTDYNDAYARLMDLLHRSDIRTPSVHAEMILRALIRRVDDPMSRPDFSTGPDAPSYQMLKLTPAILACESVTNSLAFERVKAQLTGTEILRKNKVGVIDSLFGG